MTTPASVRAVLERMLREAEGEATAVAFNKRQLAADGPHELYQRDIERAQEEADALRTAIQLIDEQSNVTKVTRRKAAPFYFEED